MTDKLSRIWCFLTTHDWDVVMVEDDPTTMEAKCARCGEERGFMDYASPGGKDFPTEELSDQ